MDWRRFDTLALRLFVLMWATLLASHAVAFWGSVPVSRWLGVDAALGGAPPARPGPPPSGPGPGGPPPGTPPLTAVPPPDLPAATRWVDYGLRGLVIALGAALAARWIARPMRRLSRAAGGLSEALDRGRPLPVLDTAQGSVEMRRAAGVFNQMAQRLQAQFDARGLHLAAVSHDLRTPLTRLRMRVEDAPPALADAAAADIREMNEMIDSTLAVLREQRDGRPPDVLMLRALVAAVVDDLAAGLPDDVPPPRLADGADATVRARPIALRRILANLAGNALRYGQGVVLSIEPAPDGGHRVHVDDGGPGIPPERLAQVFQPWVRGADGGGPGGWGLGLAIARDLAERDGARLTLANRPEGGLRATLWLPAA